MEAFGSVDETFDDLITAACRPLLVVIARVLTHADRDVLARAVFGDLPGHPVLIGRGHWTPLARSISGDARAQAYLTIHGAVRVQCGDLAVGEDRDHLP